MSTRTASWLAWSLCALTVALVTCVVAFTVLTGTGPRDFTFLLGVVSSTIVGAIVASRRPSNPIGWFLLASAACFAVSEAAFRYAIYGLVIEPGSLPLSRAMAWPETWMWVPGIALIVLFLPLYFPTGHLLSSRWRPVLWLALLLCVATAGFQAFWPGEVEGVAGVTNPLGIEALRTVRVVEGSLLLFVGLVFLAVASLMIRFRRSRGQERQQMKWLTYTAITMTALIVLTNLSRQNSALYTVMEGLTGLVLAGMPVAVGVAVLRYRLYDVDVIINRTLVYGTLTAMLIVVYFGGVAATQAIFRTITGQEQQPQLAVVVSTLVIAALFNPLRRRIQSLIDRRFYRRKYDAVMTLEAFSAKLRDETNLDSLSDDLVEVVRETMQPAHVSFWLRPDTSSRREQPE
jgi:hypothetical protein